jgi:hypothetical protein
MKKNILIITFFSLIAGFTSGYIYYELIHKNNSIFEDNFQEYRDSTFYENPQLSERLQEKVIDEFSNEINNATVNFGDFIASKFVLPGRYDRHDATNLCKLLGVGWKLPSINQLKRIKYIETDSCWYTCSETNQNDTIFTLSDDQTNWTRLPVEKGLCEYRFNPKTRKVEIGAKGIGGSPGKVIPIKEIK